MKKIIYFFGIFLLFLSVRPALAEWTKVNTYIAGTAYVDFDRIRENKGQVYFWYLLDFFKQTENGTLSASFYVQGDCEIFRLNQLSASLYQAPMGEGLSSTTELDPEWQYPNPNSTMEKLLLAVCDRQNTKRK